MPPCFNDGYWITAVFLDIHNQITSIKQTLDDICIGMVLSWLSDQYWWKVCLNSSDLDVYLLTRLVGGEAVQRKNAAACCSDAFRIGKFDPRLD